MSLDKKENGSLRVGLISLGCAKNLVDAEIMLGTLLRDGVEITSEPSQADVVIVNTCSFIDSAQEESVDAILESVEVREANNRGQGLVVAGCLSQRFRDDLPKLLPEVDAFMGIDQVPRVGEIVREALHRRRLKTDAPATPAPPPQRKNLVGKLATLEQLKLETELDSGPDLRGTNQFGRTKRVLGHAGAARLMDASPLIDVTTRPKYIPDYVTPRFRLTPRHFAYLKIAEGCNHPCSFCIIPAMRGSHRSRPQADVVSEARALLEDGVKELNLISQDSTYYGLDLRGNHSRAIAAPDRFHAAVRSLPTGATTICTLIRELDRLPGDFWIRLLYTHPAHWTDELIETIASSKKVARYIDIPLQHIHAIMLERMRRETTQEYIVDLIHRIRRGIPGIALRTTFIVGFPGETEEYFQTLLHFIQQTKFERLGVFTYSQEEGTRAGRMAGQIPEKVRAERRATAMATQLEVSRGVGASFVGRKLKVLVEREVSARELRKARIESWEHKLIRSGGSSRPVKGPVFLARGEADAPDIDGRVYVRGKVAPGDFAQVTITGHSDYDLLAQA